jgi:uncharacterized membrane protein
MASFAALVLLSTATAAKADITVCNDMQVTVNVSLGYKDPKTGWQSWGWAILGYKGCFISKPHASQYVYLYARPSDGTQHWMALPDQKNSGLFCFNDRQGFVSRHQDVVKNNKIDCEAAGLQSMRYREIDTKNSSNYTFTLSDANRRTAAPPGQPSPASPPIPGEHTLEKAIAAADLCARMPPMPQAKSYDLPDNKTIMASAEFTQPSQSVLCMRGNFWLETSSKIRKIHDPQLVRILVISSPGGWSEPAIELALLAERNDWLIVVQGICASSCANYVFLSRAAKIVLTNSVVAWHGTPPDPSQVKRGVRPYGPEQGELYFMAINSKRFLTERGIPIELTSQIPQAGHSAAYVARLKSLYKSGANPPWSFSKKILVEKFKVSRIIHMWEPANPEAGTEMAQREFQSEIFFFQ